MTDALAALLHKCFGDECTEDVYADKAAWLVAHGVQVREPLQEGQMRCSVCLGSGVLRHPEPGEMVDI